MTYIKRLRLTVVGVLQLIERVGTYMKTIEKKAIQGTASRPVGLLPPGQRWGGPYPLH